MNATGALVRTLNAEHIFDRVLAGAQPVRDFELTRDRLIILSDQHRGSRNIADEFVRCEPNYLDALAHYAREGFALLCLGDVEELWKERPRAVIDAHRSALDAERAFARGAGLHRVWGNHDACWSMPAVVDRWLSPAWRGPLPVHEALRMHVHEAGRHIGSLLFTHGHQGTLDSDWLSLPCKWILRLIWKPLQLLTAWSAHPASTGGALSRRERTLQHWARSRNITLASGHTHRACIRPHYLNSGACSFADGSITGIELGEGWARQVHWHMQGGRAIRDVRAQLPMRTVLGLA
jgi:hypothetical protein